MIINDISTSDYGRLIEIWDKSVRATHDFLTEKDIEYLRPLILEEYFAAVELRCVKDSHGNILGFSGVADGNLEMLFVDPQSMGQGVGSMLCRYAIENLAVTKVDVNEQNPRALGFYEHIGFRVVGRSDLDGQGRPFPLLHMQLAGCSNRSKV